MGWFIMLPCPMQPCPKGDQYGNSTNSRCLKKISKSSSYFLWCQGLNHHHFCFKWVSVSIWLLVSIPEVVQTLASYLTTLLGLVENTVRCGACYILWFNTPIKKKFSCPQTFLSCPCSKFCKLQGNYSITCISQGKRFFLPGQNIP